MLKMLSQETIEFLDALATASGKAWQEGGVFYSFESTNTTQRYTNDDRSSWHSHATHRAFHPELTEAESTALVTLLKYARGQLDDEPPTATDFAATAELLRLLKKDLSWTGITFSTEASFTGKVASVEAAGLSGLIELMGEWSAFSLTINWSID